MTHRRPLLAVAAALVALALSACSGSAADAGSSAPASASPSASETNPYGAAVVDPLGADEPVLTLDGGSAGKVGLTLAELEALGTTTVTVNEPFVQKVQTFTGVPLSAVLDRGGIASTATVDTIALNDYEYSGLASDFEASDAIIATQRDGQPIPYDQGGPIRLVYPDGTSLSGVLDAWNWSLDRLSVASA
ncbi:molybdopterin-dependent oxidoreductase [Longivirga aurantiaca]|uniref:Molybdopterin-dependent oxidoreductase n=1 Tax=Longivirga aurantiaca TaxID=1837743 RepID=A0ABW1SYC6_9ACTN